MNVSRPGETLILTGTPGSGKTAAAGFIAEHSRCPTVHLHADDFWHFIKAGSIPPWDTTAHRQNAVVVRSLAAAAAGYAQGSYFVIVDGIIGPWFLDIFRDQYELPLHYAVLRPDVDEAIRRCGRRGGNTLSDATTISQLHQQFANLGALEGHALCVSGLDVYGTGRAIVEAMEGGRFRLALR